MKYITMLLYTLLVAATVMGCTTAHTAVPPTKARVLVFQDSRLERAPNVLVLVSRINVCDPGFMSGGSTTGIDAYLVRTDSNGEFDIPSTSYSHVCSRVIFLSNGFLPGYQSQYGHMRLYYEPEVAKHGVTENDTILIPSKITEDRGSELARTLYSLFSSSTMTSEMSRQIYYEMLPEIDKLSQLTSKWNEECYRIGATARRIDKEINRNTCKYYEYQSITSQRKSATEQPQQGAPGDAPKPSRP